MNCLPLFENQANSVSRPVAHDDELAPFRVTRLVSDHAKFADHFDVQVAERATSSFNLPLSPLEAATSASNTPSDSPSRTERASVQNKTIRKLKDSEDWGKFLKNQILSKKTLGQLIVQDEKDESGSSVCDSNSQEVQTKLISIEKSIKKSNSEDKDVCFLNKLTTDAKKMNFSGLNVFIEDDDSNSLSFPANSKTVKFVV